MGAATGQFRTAATEGADHLPQLRRYGAIPQFPLRAPHWVTTGERRWRYSRRRRTPHTTSRCTPVINRTRSRQPRYGSYFHLWTYGLRQDSPHRISRRHAGSPGRDPGRASTKTGGWRSWSARSAANILPLRNGARPDSTRCSCRLPQTPGVPAAAGCICWRALPEHRRSLARQRTSIRRCAGRCRWRRARRLSRLIDFLDPTDPEGLHARLERWCESADGDYAWAFDNVEDSVVGRIGGQPVIGFDVTEFLDHDVTRAPVTLYLFHLVRQLLDGRRLVCWMDEFWRLLADPAFESFAKDGPKTWRKLNGVMCLATQSASDVLEAPSAARSSSRHRPRSSSRTRMPTRRIHARLRASASANSASSRGSSSPARAVPG